MARSRRCAAHGSEEQKGDYLPKIDRGSLVGHDNLTEPQCGTDLGLIRHEGGAQRRRLLQPSPARRSGISGGEAGPGTENIVHLVSREGSPGAPDTTKRHLAPSSCRNPRQRDAASGCATRSLLRRARRRRLGIHATGHCVMNYERRDGLARGESRNRACADVHDDRRGPPRGSRFIWASPLGEVRLQERRRLATATVSRARRHRRAKPPTTRDPIHRAPRRAPQPHGPEVGRRGRAALHLRALGRECCIDKAHAEQANARRRRLISAPHPGA